MIKPGDKITVNGTTLIATSVEHPTDRPVVSAEVDSDRPWARHVFEVTPSVIVTFDIVNPDKYRALS